MSEWQDISTAPKDGQYVLVSWPYNMAVAGWLDKQQAWCVQAWDDWGQAEVDGTPTHWMPLPPPPAKD